MAYSFSDTSIKRLKGVHPDLVAIITLALEKSKVDFMVIEGVRTQARQNELYSWGRTKVNPNTGKMTKVTWTKNSRHKIQKDGYGHAVDLAPYVGGKVDWSSSSGNYETLNRAIVEASEELGIPIEWGGNWTKNKDKPHYQLPLNYVATNRPLSKTRTMRGVEVGATGTVITLAGAVTATEQVNQMVDKSSGLLSKLQNLPSNFLIFGGLAIIIGVLGYITYTRYDDRQKGYH